MEMKKTICEYVWIDANGNARSKCRTITFKKVQNPNDLTISEFPIWSFDGSSTGQAVGKDSEVILKPQAIYKNPFYEENKIFDALFVLCDCYDKYMQPIKSNSRYMAETIFKKTQKHEPWFGMEQEYVLYDCATGRPVGWPEDPALYPESQGKYYCGVGSDKVFFRNVVDKHYEYCLKAGINIYGTNAEVMPGQWEYQIGPCIGIEMGDQLIMSRYILAKICEDFNLYPSFDPKPQIGDWNGSGCHTNYSTIEMRDKNGFPHILEAIEKLGKKHKEHLSVYGDNSKRLIGTHETSSKEVFTWGIADRTASVRIPLFVYQDQCGYLEDRRPAADCDPYNVTRIIAETTLL